MTIKERWKKTSLANKLLVIVGAAAFLVSALSFVSAVFQIFLAIQGGNQAADRTDRILANLNWLAQTMHGELKEAERARTASEKQSGDALRASIDSARTDQRAWIGLRDSQLKTPEINKPFSATVIFANSGKSPALDVHWNVIMVPHLGSLDVSKYAASSERRGLKPTTIKSRGVIVPGSALVISNTTDPPNPNQKLLDGLDSGDVVLYFLGEVYYRDIFNVQHLTRFCELYSPKSKMFAFCDTYNSAN